MTLLDDLKLQYKTGNTSIRLIFLNIILFVFSEILFSVLKLFSVQINYIDYISLSTSFSDLIWKPWSIISYAFFHSGILHLLMNMLMLFYVGRLFLTFFTQKQLLGLYLLATIFSGIVYILGYNFLPALVNVNTQMIGASGAIMAILFATVSYQPYMEVNLFGVFKLRLWHIVAIILFIDLVQLSINNTGGHIAHIGGAIFGYIYIKLLLLGTDLSIGINKIMDGFVEIFNKKQSTPFKKVHVNPRKPIVTKQSKIVVKDKTQQQIDEILDKISKSGYDGLTTAEKEFLFKAGK